MDRQGPPYTVEAHLSLPRDTQETTSGVVQVASQVARGPHRAGLCINCKSPVGLDADTRRDPLDGSHLRRVLGTP